MTNQHLKQLIIGKYPNGFSFEPTALRLLEGKIGYIPEENDLAEMKQEMFQRQDGVYLFCEHVANEKTRKEIINTAEEWIRDFGCFSLEVLRDRYSLKIENLLNDIVCFEDFLKQLHYPDSVYKTTWFSSDKFRIARSVGVKCEAAIAKLTQCIEKIIDQKYCAADYEIIEEIPALNNALLLAVIKDKMPYIIATENNGTMCFQLAENHIPDDLNEKIHEAVNKLEFVNLEITQEALHTVLSLLYQKNFNETYLLPDMKTFRKIIERYYNCTNRIWKNNIFTVSIDNE
ncbi:MAG: hypothetical protein LBF88_11220 [Planctomycetaceae bacterium]|jgi:hypothetical protein|nr:hypothetical protein [Planctomycetaceae bacterium]